MIEASLVDALRTGVASERRAAAQEIAEIAETGDTTAADLLVSQLHEESSRAVKEAILSSLRRIWSANSVDEMIDLLRDPDPFVRAEASDMLRQRVGAATEVLSQLARSEDKDLRKFAIDILSQAPEGPPDAACLHALKDEDMNVVISMIESIGTGRRRAFRGPVLEIALHRPHPMAMCACLETLGLIGDRSTLEALRGMFPDACKVPELFLLPFLKLLGGTAGPESIDEICRLMAERGEDEAGPLHRVAVDALTGIVSRNPEAVLSAGSEAVLLGLLRPGEPSGQQLRQEAESKFHIVRLLGHFTGSEAVATALLPLLATPDRALCLTVAEALAGSSDPRVALALSDLLAAETDPEMIEYLEEIVGRRAHWNSLPTNSLS